MREEEWHKKQRDYHHRNGKEIALPEMLHKVLLRDEVLTNLTFVDVNTQPYESRPQVKHEVRQSSNRRRGSNDDDNDNQQESNEEIPDRQDSMVPTQRLRQDLPCEYHITDSQQLTFSERKSQKFDKVSLFGLREPRLLGLANTLKIYFRCFVTDKTTTKLADIEKLWNEARFDMRPWFDCLQRRTKLRMSAIDIFIEHIEENINDVYTDIGDFTRSLENEAILELLQLVKADDNTLSTDEMSKKTEFMSVYIEDDSKSLPPIPVWSMITPTNPHQFIIHLLLTLGKFDTEKDILLKPSMRECFKAARLVGSDDSEDAIRHDASKILYRYIMEQLVYSPYSLSKAEYYILIANQVILDAVLLDGISMNDMPPVTMVHLVEKVGGEEKAMWKRMKERQLDAIRHQVSVRDTPDAESLMDCSRSRPISWDPVETLVQSENQTSDSYAEQKFAVSVVTKEIQSYMDPEYLLQCKNTIVHGCPGAGKSFLSLYCVLYALSQGLNVCPTSITGVNAARNGGIHWHSLFCVDPNQNNAPPSRQAELAIMKIERNELLVYKIRTMDILYFDELYQLSSEQLAVTEMILRKVRKSNQPFGGVLLIANMDHTQGGAINGTPLLLSSFMYTCFQLVELNHSVRAHGDADFIRIQQIARMDPYHLQENQHLITEFRDLISRKFTFKSDWSDVPPLMMRAFSRRQGTTDALDVLVEQERDYFRRHPTIQHSIAESNDFQRIQGSNEWTNATQQTRAILNTKLREVQTLVFSKGTKFEITMNHTSTGGDDPQFFQSQIAVVFDVPSPELIRRRGKIEVLIPPPGAEDSVNFDDESCPSKQDLLNLGWKKVGIPIANYNKIHNVRGNFQAKRDQYALRPLGATTISKAQGQTLPSGIAIEFSKQNAPWSKDLVVVSTSRSQVAHLTWIIGSKAFAVDLMCKLIQQPTEYTRMISGIIAMLTVNRSSTIQQPTFGIDLRRCFPFRSVHFELPVDSSGFIYILYSIRDKRVTYTGETENMRRRLTDHNSGLGAIGTAPISLRPWAIGAIITGAKLKDKNYRLFVEEKWRDEIRRLGRTNVPTLTRIELVEKIVNDLNASNEEDDQFKFVITVEGCDGQNDGGEAVHYSTGDVANTEFDE